MTSAQRLAAPVPTGTAGPAPHLRLVVNNGRWVA